MHQGTIRIHAFGGRIAQRAEIAGHGSTDAFHHMVWPRVARESAHGPAASTVRRNHAFATVASTNVVEWDVFRRAGEPASAPANGSTLTVRVARKCAALAADAALSVRSDVASVTAAHPRGAVRNAARRADKVGNLCHVKRSKLARVRRLGILSGLQDRLCAGRWSGFAHSRADIERESARVLVLR